ncbi:MAG TPA: Fe-S-containing protein [Candidatus Angelobacter sp.]|nr:Fe-S-containing protein [Candidatus Angelobacter sp.]
MFQALVVTLREGVEAALIVGISLVYLAKIGRSDLRRIVYAALVAAFAASVVAGIALSSLENIINRDKLEGWIMLVAAVLVVGMIVFMMHTARKLKGEIEGKVGSLAGAGSQWGLFAFIFFMVFREGAETVGILAGVSLNTSELMSFLGTLVGVALAVLFGVMFVKGSVRIDLRRFFRVTTVILLFVAAQLVISGLHELSETGVVGSSKQEMALIGPIVRNPYFFPVTMLALVALMVLLEYRRRQPDAAPASSPAEQRKLQWNARRDRFWAILVCATAFFFMIGITAEFVYAETPPALSKAVTLTPDQNGHILISTEGLAEGDLRRYSVDVNGVPVRFLLYRKPDGKVATVFDACQICGGVGFFKGANGLVCKNCSAPINPQSVGQQGGCNPIPLQSAPQGESVVINVSYLTAQVGQFSH